MTNPEAGQLEDNLNELFDTVLKADENGLFSNKNTELYLGTVRKHILEAFSALDATTNKEAEFRRAQQLYFDAYHELDEAIEKRGLRWRMMNLYAVPAVLYSIALFLIVFLGARFLSDNYFGIPSWVLLLGMLGGSGQALWYLWQQISQKTYRKAWLPWVISSPFLGLLFGLIVYLIYAGFTAASNSATTFVGGPGPMLVTLLGGFSWRQTVDLMNKTFQSIFGSKK